MNQLNTKKVSLTFGLFLGAFHLFWSALVFVGIGQSLIDFILWAHMIHVVYVVGPFELGASVLLIIATTIIGCFFCYVFARIWNWLHR